MWSIRAWAAASNERAVNNARAATTECSRRRVERTEVALFLDERAAQQRGDHAPAGIAAVEHLTSRRLRAR